MPIPMPVVPGRIKIAFLKGVDDFPWENPQLLRAIQNDPDGIRGLPVYTLSLDSVRSGARMEATQFAGWRVFYRAPYDAAAADIVEIEPNSVPAIVSVSSGMELAKALDSVNDVLSQEGNEPGANYDVRLLRVAGAFVEACWLKSNTNLPDVFVPVITGIREMQAGERFSVPSFFSVVAKVSDIAFEFGNH